MARIRCFRRMGGGSGCGNQSAAFLLSIAALTLLLPFAGTRALGGSASIELSDPVGISEIAAPSPMAPKGQGSSSPFDPVLFSNIRGDSIGELSHSSASASIPVLAPVKVAAPRRPKEAEPVGVPEMVQDIDSRRHTTSDTASLLDSGGGATGLPGAFTRSAGGLSGMPVIDGMADDQLQAQVGGMVLQSACANHMNPPLSYMAPSQVGSITVYNQIVPVSVGGNAIGGAVLAEPAMPSFAANPGQTIFKGDTGTFYRSNGNAYGGYLSGTAATDRFNITFNGSYAASENYFAGADFHPSGPAFAVGPLFYQSPLPLNNKGNPPPFIPGNMVGSSYYQEQMYDVAMAYHTKDHLLQLDLGVQDIPYQGFPNQRMDMTNNLQVYANARYTGKFEWGVLEAQAFEQAIRHEMNFGEDKQYYYGSLATVLAPGMPMLSRGNNAGAKLKASIPLSDQHILRVGAEYYRYDLYEFWPPSPTTLPPGHAMGGMAPNTFLLLNNAYQQRYDAFLEWDAHWNRQWTTQLGLRSDTVAMDTGPVMGYNSMYDRAPTYPATTFNLAERNRLYQNWDATAQAIYTRNAHETYSFGYSLKSEAPNPYELYTWSTSMMAMEMVGWFGDGNYYVGNLNLQPMIANTISATADWHDTSGNYGLQLTPYASYIFNYIDVQRLPVALGGSLANLTSTQGFVSLQFCNVNAEMVGADLSGHALLAKDTPLGDFSLKGIASYVRGVRSDGQNLYQVMPLNSTLTVYQKLGHLTNSIQGQFVYAKNTVEELRNEIPTSAYALMNLNTSYKWGSVEVYAGISNVFNSLYYLPLGGAYIGQGATMSGPFGPAWGIAVPGMGRMYYVGANVTF